MPRVPHVIRNLPFLSNFATRVFAVAVADEERAVGQPRDVGRPLEVRAVVPGFVAFAERQQQLLAVVAELPDLVMDVVHHPDAVLRIVGVDQDRVRAAAVGEQVIPLRPRLDRLPVRIDDDDAVAELRRGRRRLLVERAPEAGEAERQRGGQLQLAAVRDEDPVGRLGEDAAGRAPDVAGLRIAERERPVRDDASYGPVRSSPPFSCSDAGATRAPIPATIANERKKLRMAVLQAGAHSSTGVFTPLHHSCYTMV